MNRFLEPLHNGRRPPRNIEEAEAYLEEGRYLFGDIAACTPLSSSLGSNDLAEEFLWGLRQDPCHNNSERMMIAIRAIAEPAYMPRIVDIFLEEMQKFQALCVVEEQAPQVFALERHALESFAECEKALLWQNVLACTESL